MHKGFIKLKKELITHSNLRVLKGIRIKEGDVGN